MKTIETEKILRYLIKRGGICSDVSCSGKDTGNLYENRINNEKCHLYNFCLSNKNFFDNDSHDLNKMIQAKEQLESIDKLKFLESL